MKDKRLDALLETMHKTRMDHIENYSPPVIYHRRGIEMPNLKMKLAPGPGFFVRKKGDIRKCEREE